MAWRDVMAATMRLTDLYSSRREFGGEGSVVCPPAHKNNTDDPHAGVLFDLGTAILEFLDVCESDAPGTYILISEVYGKLRNEFPECSESDFHFVLKKLWHRYSVFFVRDSALLNTALIEKAPAGERIRLSAKGRIALALSEASEDWAYLDLDAERIVRAITRGNFREVEKFSTAMAQRIRDASLQIRRILEMPSIELQEQALFAENALYAETVSNIQSLVSQAMNMFRGEEVRDKIDRWVEINPDEEGIDYKISSQLHQILSMIETVSRNLAKIISAVQKGDRTGVRTPNFQAAVHQFVLKGDIEVARSALRVFVIPDLSHACIHDAVKPIEFKHSAPREQEIYETGDAVPLGFKEYEFVKNHGAQFIEALKQGPIFLEELLSHHEFSPSNMEELAELVGAFLDAPSMGFKGRFLVSPRGDRTTFDLDGNITTLQSLVLRYEPSE